MKWKGQCYDNNKRWAMQVERKGKALYQDDKGLSNHGAKRYLKYIAHCVKWQDRKNRFFVPVIKI